MTEIREEDRMILNTVKNIAREKIKPRAAEIDEKAEFPWDNVKTFAENGLLAPLLPEKYGGISSEYLLFSKILEEVSKVCASSALILIAHADGFLPILWEGTDALKDRCLPDLAKGQLSGFAATEPEAGSDILSMRTRATRQGNEYIINGQKRFITNGSIAGVLSVYAFTDPERKAKGVTAFAVEKGAKGLIYGKNERKMGMRGCFNSELFFEDLAVPLENRLGEEGEGFPKMMTALTPAACLQAHRPWGWPRRPR